MGGISRDLKEFKELTKRDAEQSLIKELTHIIESSPINMREDLKKLFDEFQKLFKKYLQDSYMSVEWNKIEKLPTNAIIDYKSLKEPNSDIVKPMLEKLIVIKLNGGLGTSMGCQGPKSLIPVSQDLTFLDLTIQQIEFLNQKYNVNVPLVLMNSFNTSSDTEKVLRKYAKFNIQICCFEQSRYPRINKESFMPIPHSWSTEENPQGWYPPGHGDFYKSFAESGLLDKFLQEGKEFCFISNIDNLGATVDLLILNFLLHSDLEAKPEFVMEVTEKTRADVKGGTLIQYENKLRLLEIAQVPKRHIDNFKSVKTFKIFNTNNLWVKLDAISRLVKKDNLDMEVIVNHKTLADGSNIIQLETAVGSAMKNFEAGLGINVPRCRFLPVKKTSDLLIVMSNLYSLKQGTLIMNPKRMFDSVPLVKLGENHFAKVSEFLKRFESIPDLIELDHLTVSGDVTFGAHISLRGTVIIIANHGERIDIPSGAILENKIISGNLRILDH